MKSSILDALVEIPQKPTHQLLYVKCGKKIAPVESLADASKKYTDLIRSQNWGYSQVPKALLKVIVVDQDNNFIGRIAYNGKIFLDDRLPPIYNPYQY
jgi:hypothetical protein